MYHIIKIYIIIGIYLHEIYHWLAILLLFQHFATIKINTENLSGYCKSKDVIISDNDASYQKYGLKVFLIMFAPLLIPLLFVLLTLVTSNIYLLLLLLVMHILNFGAIVLSETDIKNGSEGLRLFLYGKKYYKTFKKNVTY